MNRKFNLLVSIVVLIVSSGVFLNFFVLPYFNYKNAVESWKTTDATITKYEPCIGTYRGKTPNAVITYRYYVEGKEYTSSRYSFGIQEFNLSEKKYAPGTVFQCHYNPSDPREAVLFMNVPVINTMGYILIASFLCCLLILKNNLSAGTPINNIPNATSHNNLSDFGGLLISAQTAGLTDEQRQPLRPTGGNKSSFRAFTKLSSTRLAFVPLKRTMIQLIVFILLFLLGTGWCVIQFKLQFWGYFVYGIFLLVSFVVVPISLYRLYSKIPIFDLESQCFWRGKKNSNIAKEMLNMTPFNKIFCIQLVTKTVSIGKGAAFSYEMNLVLNDGSRIFIFDDGDLGKMRSEIQELAVFLNRPYCECP